MWCNSLIVGAVVLAAGNSQDVKRMLLQCNEKTIIEANLNAAEVAPIEQRIVVLGGEIDEVVEAIRPKLGKFKIALNLAPKPDDTSSFKTGLIVIQNFDAVFLVPGDEPFIDPQLFVSMVKVMEQNADALIVSLGSVDNKGRLLLIRKSLFSEILSLTGDQNINEVLSAHSDKVVTLPAPIRS